MAVAQVQIAIATSVASSSTTVSGTLGAPPTAGNLMVAMLNGAPTGGAVTGWGVAASVTTTTWDDGFAYARRVVAGDGQTWSFPIGAGWDAELLLLEVSGASGTIGFTGGDSPITGGNTIANLPAAAAAGALAYVQFGLYLYNGVPAIGADTLSNGFSRLDSRIAHTSGNNSYFVCGSCAYPAGGSASTTLVAPTYPNSAAVGTPLTIVIAAGSVGSIQIGNGDNPAGHIGNGGVSGGLTGNSQPWAP